MRRLAAALLATTLLLAGCSGGADGENDNADDLQAAGTSADLKALEAVTVEGAPGSSPTVTFEQPFAVTAPVALVETPGTGAPLEPGQTLSLQYVALSGDDGAALGSTWEQESPETMVLGDPEILPALGETLTGQNVGVRVLFAAPGGGAVSATETGPAQDAYPATVMVIEVVDARTVPSRAQGEPVAPVTGLPVVTLAENGAPSIEVPAGATPPTDLVVQPLIVGTGPVVESGQSLTVQYSGWLLDGTGFDSSWEGGKPFTTTIGTGSVIAGWDQGLIGRTVGSQVLLIVPPALGYGDADKGTIPPSSTLIFVVDILDAS